MTELNIEDVVEQKVEKGSMVHETVDMIMNGEIVQQNILPDANSSEEN